MTTYADKPWLRYYDSHVPESLKPYPAIPVFDLLDRAVGTSPDASACITASKNPRNSRDSQVITYREIGEASDRLAAALVKMGVEKGDRVGVDFVNTPQFVIAFFGILKAGGIVAAINPHFPPQRKADQLADSGAKVLITMARYYDAINAIRDQTVVERVIVSNLDEYFPASENDQAPGLRLLPDDHRFQPLLEANAGESRPSITIDPEVDTAIFQYTGGTTGIPKAACGPHSALAANTLQFSTWLADPDPALTPDSFLAVIPLYHIFGMVAVMSYAASISAPIILVPDARDLDNIVAHIAAFHPTIFMGVPSLYNALSLHEEIVSGRVDLGSLRVCISGSAPLAPEIKRRFEAISGCPILEGFGMSETPTATHINPLKGRNKEGSIGLPLPDVECRIVNLEDGETDVPVGEPGELILRGPAMMSGYHNMPEETVNVLREGWLYTGDVARMDEEGYFTIVDRKKDMIIVGGFNVYPNVIEKALMAHESIAEAAAAGIPNADIPGEEIPKAWVVLAPGREATTAALFEHCRAYLAPYEIPRVVEFVEKLPRTPVGKVLRRELVRLEQEGG
ncbi:MAG: long-chain fatty acid--CoA ligase [Anaerolineae bacterium]|nr:long-chain fatty acid--CoA ligase [Anaerolineae bacterium]